MRFKVLLIEDDESSVRVLKRVIGKANLDVVLANTLAQAKIIFETTSPELYLCAVVGYSLPDAPHGQAINFTINAFIPTIVITSEVEEDIRENILAKSIVDYIPKQNAQMFEYLNRLLVRLEKNKQIGVLVVDKSRHNRGILSSLLGRHNFITFDTSSAAQALDLLQRHPLIKLMLVEEELADTKGLELVSEARKLYDKDQLSIIGLSTNTHSSLLAQFIKSGANDFLRKPYCHEEFFCRIVQNVEHIEQIEAIRRAANSDYLTGLPNRRHFFNKVNHTIHRGQAPMSLALIDLDNFKLINDSFGHDYGDVVLKEVSKMIIRHFSSFHYSRFGGEEFCIFMAQTGQSEAIELLNSFRHEISQKVIKSKGISHSCTLSIGVTSRASKKIESMLSIADEHLYNAKAQGRNRVIGDPA
ncbi:MAG: diguanylate cyclase [Aliiglaciecola sp.]|uniref:GGDEF domain-containing response regulator n=1 Tax=Aliiglaciecola sp. TaxID=1872441 RepID=UPI0032996200